MRSLGLAALLVLGVVVVLALARSARKRLHRPRRVASAFLESRFRKWLQPSREIVERSGMAKGMVVLDPDFVRARPTVAQLERAGFRLSYTVTATRPSVSVVWRENLGQSC